MNKILTQLLTEADNATHDIVRWLAFIAVLCGIGLEIYAVITGKAFDLESYGLAIASMLGSLGVSLRLNNKPSSNNPS